MTVFVCIDDNKGMMFNNRRQSRDSAVAKEIIRLAEDSRLLMSKYSAKLFTEYDVVADDSFLELAEEGDCCFVENGDIGKCFDKITRLVVFKWNRIYPSDRRLNVDFDMLKCEEIYDFEGTSHEKITCEIWKNEKN